MKVGLCLFHLYDLSRLYYSLILFHPHFFLWRKASCTILLHHVVLVANLNFLQQPNDEDPLNHEAAAVLRDDPKKFEKNVHRAMAGGYVGETHFPRCM